MSQKQSVEIIKLFDNYISYINPENCSEIIQNFINSYKNSALENNNKDEVQQSEAKLDQSVGNTKNNPIASSDNVKIETANTHDNETKIVIDNSKEVETKDMEEISEIEADSNTRRRNSAPAILDNFNKDNATLKVLQNSTGHAPADHSEDKAENDVNQEKETTILTKVAQQISKDFKEIKDILSNISETNIYQNLMLTQLLQTNIKTSELCELSINKSAAVEKLLLETSENRRAEVETEISLKKKHVTIKAPNKLDKEINNIPNRKHSKVQQASTQIQTEQVDTTQQSAVKPTNKRKSLDESHKNARNVKEQNEEYEISKTCTPEIKITLKRKSIDNVAPASLEKRRERQSFDASTTYDDSEDETDNTQKKTNTEIYNEDEVDQQKRLKDIKVCNKMGDLPPEYDEHDTRWMLRHPYKTDGVIELLPDSNIYIDQVYFEKIDSMDHDGRKLAINLLKGIFTDNALLTCYIAGPRTENNLPDLDKNAVELICKFIKHVEDTNGWNSSYTRLEIITSMRNAIKNFRKKCRIHDNSSMLTCLDVSTDKSTDRHKSLDQSTKKHEINHDHEVKSRNVKDHLVEYDISQPSTSKANTNLKRKHVDNVQAANIKKRRHKRRHEKRQSSKDNVTDNDSEEEFEVMPDKTYTRMSVPYEFEKKLADLDYRFRISSGKLMPRDYDEHDTRWTLKHHYRTSEVTELIANHDIYIDRKQLEEILPLAKKTCRKLATLLLKEIFIEDALLSCRLPDTKKEDYRPILDKVAVKVICDFVQEKGKIVGWDSYEERDVIKAMEHVMYKMKKNEFWNEIPARQKAILNRVPLN